MLRIPGMPLLPGTVFRDVSIVQKKKNNLVKPKLKVPLSLFIIFLADNQDQFSQTSASNEL